MTSIPADPSMVLGQIISPWRVLKLDAIAQIQRPVDDANDRFNAKSLMYHKMNALEQEMLNLGMQPKDIEKIRTMKNKCKSQMVNAAMLMATISIGVETIIAKLRTDIFSQSLISYTAESPVDLKASPIKSMNLSFDSLKFDVQYLRLQSVMQLDLSLAVSAHVSQTVNDFSKGESSDMGKNMSNSVAASMNTALDFQRVEGTLVITAYCTHKMADVFAPLTLDPERAVAAWNFEMKALPLGTDPISMFVAATALSKVPPIPGITCMSVLSGVTRASSFVGMVHMLKSESTMSAQASASVASAVQKSLEEDMAVNGMTGGYGNSSTFGAKASSLLSTSNLGNTASLACMGVIPDIKVSTVETVVKTLNPDPERAMNALGALQAETKGTANSNMSTLASKNQTGARYVAMKNDFIENSVDAIAQYDKSCNSVIDSKSMFTAFESYVDKCIKGDGVGVPTNFFYTNLTIGDVAKAYIRKFYPNGAAGEGDAARGRLGLAPKEGDKDDQK